MSEQKSKRSNYYNVNGRKLKGSQLMYEDCEILFTGFIEKYGHYPSARECISRNNLPHSKILIKILDEKGIMLSDWQKRFGKTKQVRSDPKNYNKYVQRYKDIANNLGRALYECEIVNNIYDIPHIDFFIKYCPDKNVKTYVDFVSWCGYKYVTKVRDKDEIIKELIEKQKTLGRPVTLADINSNMFSFSAIVINRIWGSFAKCKEELGLEKSMSSKPDYSFEEYKNVLNNCLNDIYLKTNRRIISWSDIESDERGKYKLNHKTVMKYFNNNNQNLNKYITDYGFKFSPYSWGIVDYSDEGELYRSTYEIDYSNFLKNDIQLYFSKSYFRDVYYSTFTNCNSRLNCDYKIVYNNQIYYIEIAGYLKNENEYGKYKSNSQRKNDYKNTLNTKIRLLNESKVNYLIIYADDMKNGLYKKMTKQFLGIT